jgi:hypothetical protein
MDAYPNTFSTAIEGRRMPGLIKKLSVSEFTPHARYPTRCYAHAQCLISFLSNEAKVQSDHMCLTSRVMAHDRLTA